MKTIIALCLLAAICTVDAFRGLDQLKLQIQQSKSTIDSKIFNLGRFERNTQADTTAKASNKYVEQMTNHNNYVNPTIADIRKEVEAAKKEGKNAQPCYDNAFASLRENSQTAIKDGQQCRKTGESSIRSKLSFIQDLISIGQRLKTELDAILLNCYSSNIMETVTCGTIKLGTTNIQVRDFESKANSAEYTAKSASNDVVLQVDKCLRDIFSIAHQRITEARLAATKCLQAL